MDTVGKLLAVVGAAGSAFAFIVLLALVFAIPTWLLWNWLMPDLFGLREITLVQAWGLKFLAACLFKSSSVEIKGKK